MADEKQEAAQAASRARGEAKAAARDTARAVKAVSEPVVEAVTDKAEDVADKAQDAAQNVSEAASTFLSRLTVSQIGNLSLDGALAFACLGGSMLLGATSVQTFRQMGRRIRYVARG